MTVLHRIGPLADRQVLWDLVCNYVSPHARMVGWKQLCLLPCSSLTTKKLLHAVRVLLRRDPEICITGETGNYHQTTQSILNLKPQVVVMDLHMPDESSMSRQEIKSVLDTSGSELIAMSFWNDENTQALAKNLGAVTLLDKLRLVTELIPAIRAATVKQSASA